MLYLSATTITTLGFGDIVPLTTPARLAISIEAVIGIVMMGLFLNAVSRER
jgi:voltage-gated potassium channel Kch